MRYLYYFLFTVGITTACANDNDNLSISHWKIKSKWFDNKIFQDTLDLNILDLEILGLIEKSTLDSICSNIDTTTTIDQIDIYLSFKTVKMFNSNQVIVYDIYLKNIVNQNTIRLLYTEEYGALVKTYSDVQMLLEKLIWFQGNEITTIGFHDFCIELLKDTVLFPIPEPIPPPDE